MIDKKRNTSRILSVLSDRSRRALHVAHTSTPLKNLPRSSFPIVPPQFPHLLNCSTGSGGGCVARAFRTAASACAARSRAHSSASRRIFSARRILSSIAFAAAFWCSSSGRPGVTISAPQTGQGYRSPADSSVDSSSVVHVGQSNFTLRVPIGPFVTLYRMSSPLHGCRSFSVLIVVDSIPDSIRVTRP